MTTYNVIEISTGTTVYSNNNYDECINWINTYGNIIDYTIISN
jgi:hypothetical protein